MSWEKIKLGKLCTIEKGTTGIQKAIPGEYPMVVTSEERKSHNEYQFDDEAVVIPLVSSTGHGHKSLKRIHYQSGKFALGSILCAVIPKNKKQLSAEYLYRYLDLNKENELVSRMKGMANVTLPIKEIADIDIPVPPLNEQLQFIKKYEQTETHSESLRNELVYQSELLTQLRQSFLREAMQGKLVKQDPKDGHAKDLLEKIKAEKAKSGKKEKELPTIKPEEIPFEIPENWVWCRLGEIAYIASGSTPKQDAFVSSGVPYFKMYNLKNQKIDFHHKPQYIKRKIHEGQLKRSRAFPGDVLMNIVGPPLGKLAIISDEFPESNFNQAAVLIRPFVKSINRWIFWYLNEMTEINSIVTKGVAGQDNISITQSNNIRVPLPTIEEQTRIVKRIEESISLCDELQESIQESREQNNLLLQQVLKEALKG
jgi:type I restriction enzyme S subunit